jgi:hypothetical protein
VKVPAIDTVTVLQRLQGHQRQDSQEQLLFESHVACVLRALSHRLQAARRRPCWLSLLVLLVLLVPVLPSRHVTLIPNHVL